jgi:hypothetical protein
MNNIGFPDINISTPLGGYNFHNLPPSRVKQNPGGDNMGAKPLVIKATPRYSRLDGENADNYFRAGQRSALIYNEVIDPFTGALKEATGYGSENIPGREKEISLAIGDYGFLLTATPTTKRPGYKAVFDELDGFLDTRQEEYYSGERPVGVITIDSEPYISTESVLSKLENARDRVVSSDVKITIAQKPPLIDGITSMVVPLGMDMAELTQGNTDRYIEALSLQKLYNSFTSDFEQDLLDLTGFDKDSPPDQTEHMYKSLGNHVFHVKSVPYESTNWGKVLEGLDRDPPIKDPSKGGDLVLIERGILDPRLEIYDARVRGDSILVRLDGLIDRMGSLRDEFTKTKVRQRPINHYPIV